MEAVGGKYSATALDTASEHGSLHVVRLLLQRGAKMECRDKNGWTPLITAACGECDVVIELLNNKANVDAQNNDGWTALMKAATDGYTEIADVLVKAGANKDLQNEDGDSALTEAAYRGLTEVVVVLVTSGANLDLQNNKGDSAVMRATVEHESDVLRELVRRGADLNLQNEEGLTALMVSARSGRSDLTHILLEGENIDLDIQENTTNWSALFFSAEMGDVTTTQSLLKAGANPHLTDKNGLTALYVATASGSDEVCELLTQAPRSQPCDIATDQDTSAADQDSTPSQQDTSTVQQDIPSTDEDCSTTDQDISTSSRRRQRVPQALRNLANSSGKRIREIFAALDHRLKSADKKERAVWGKRWGESWWTEKAEEKDNRKETLRVQLHK